MDQRDDEEDDVTEDDEEAEKNQGNLDDPNKNVTLNNDLKNLAEKSPIKRDSQVFQKRISVTQQKRQSTKNLPYISMNNQQRMKSQAKPQLAQSKSQPVDLDYYSLQNQHSKKSVCSYRIGQPTQLKKFELNAYQTSNNVKKLDKIFKRGSMLEIIEQQKIQQQIKQRMEEEERLKAKTPERKFYSQREPRLISKLSKHEFVLNQVNQKLHKSSSNFNSMDQICQNIVKKEEARQKRLEKQEEEKYLQNNKQLFEKLDFNKKFFEPILEEREIDNIESSPYLTNKTSKIPRNLSKFNLVNSPGIVPFIDKEQAASPEFQQKQSKFFDTDVFFKRKTSKDLFVTSMEDTEKEKIGQPYKNNNQEINQCPKKTSPYIQPFKQIFQVDKPSRTIYTSTKTRQSDFKPQTATQLSTNFTMQTPKESKYSQNDLFKTTSGFQLKPLTSQVRGKREREEMQTQASVKGLTKIIWNCSHLIDENFREKQRLQSMEQYCNQEYKDLTNSYKTISGVNNCLSEL